MLLMTADHGMTETLAEETVYLNRVWPEIAESFVQLNGEPMVPAGSPRDFFLHAVPDAVPDMVDELSRRLEGVADVFSTARLLEEGLFGPAPAAPRFLERVGNVVILPHAGESVWWFEENRFANIHAAHHGGLSPDEVDIPLAALLV